MPISENQKWTALGVSTLAFAANFAVWTLFSVIGLRIRNELGLNNTEFGILVATPILTGSLSRLPLGLLTERFGGRSVYIVQMLAVAAAVYAIGYATHYWQFLLAGLGVGLAGGSFAIGITYAATHFHKRQHGTALGIFGSGNSGAAITNLVAPLLMEAYGWQTVPQIYAAGMLVITVVFWLMTRNQPVHIKARTKTAATLTDQLAPLKEWRVWQFGLYYFFMFGGFVTLALWLPKYYVDEYGMAITTACFFTLLFTVPEALIRAIGGLISDMYGARTINWWMCWICLVCLFFLCYPSTTMTIHGVDRDYSLSIALNQWVFTALVFVVGVAMGFGNASLYKIVHDYYPKSMGSAGSMVGVIGGLGGFVLPILFGLAADFTRINSSCFMLLYGILAFCMVLMHFSIRAGEYRQRLLEAQASQFLES